jgi:hypothetical protein
MGLWTAQFPHPIAQRARQRGFPLWDASRFARNPPPNVRLHREKTFSA